jgi:hypothetical protein
MPDGVIAAVENMAREQKQPIVGHGAPLFEWSPGATIQDNIVVPFVQDVPEALLEEAPEAADGDGENHNDADVFPDEAEDEPEEHHEDADVDDGSDEQDHAPDDRSEDHPDAADTDEDHRSASDEPADAYHSETPVEADVEEPDATEAPADEDPHEPAEVDPRTAAQIRHNLRPNRHRNYNHRLGHIMDDPASNESYDTQFLQSCEEEDDTQFLQSCEEEDSPPTL